MVKLRGIKKFQVIPWLNLIGNHMCRTGFISKPAAPLKAALNKSNGTVIMYDQHSTHKRICAFVRVSKAQDLQLRVLVYRQEDHSTLRRWSASVGTRLLPPSNYFFDSPLPFVTITFFAAAVSKVCRIETPCLTAFGL